MDFLDSLAFYTSSQKMVAYGFIACGCLLLASFIVLLFFSTLSSPLWQGVRVGLIVSGLMITIGGIGYLNFSTKIHQKIESAFVADQVTATANEVERMETVVRDYPKYQLVFAAIVLLALLVVVFDSGFWAGIAFPFAFLFIAILLIEAHSKNSIEMHLQNVANRTVVVP